MAGAGRRLPGDDGAAHDELWWTKRVPAREGVSVLPRAPALRKEAEDVPTAVGRPPPERVLRRTVEELDG
ncbi:DUF1992 domain-containing protein, partial [Streptomyces sp. TRM76130]|nr:DUF1992 domain-containing protein [Streptomyces sp. TRM76130]